MTSYKSWSIALGSYDVLARVDRGSSGRARLTSTVRLVARLIHLNGPPGIGKSTVARRYAEEHFGVLNCDVDVLRSLIGGWANDFTRAGALIRPAALAMISAYLDQGRDVLLPQMLTNPEELARFEQAATGVGADFVERFLMDAPDAAVRRFNERGRDSPDDRWHERVRAIVARNGGDESLLRNHTSISKLVAERPHAVVLTSVEGAIEATYQALIDSLQ